MDAAKRLRQRHPEITRIRFAAVLLVALTELACSPPHVGGPVSGATATPSAGETPTPASTASPAKACASRVLASLTEDQRIGQLFFMGLANDQLGTAERNAVVSAAVGSVWYSGLSSAPASSVAAVSASVQALAPSGPVGRIPLLIGANQEGGQIDQFHGPGFTPIPSALVLGQEAPNRLETEAASWGDQLMAAGINLEVAPVMDTVPPGTDVRNAPIGALEREFGHDPASVSAHGIAFMKGMQSAGEAAVIKHFPGLGRVTVNTDFGASAVDRQTTGNDPYLQPFADAIRAGADMVMVSTALYTQIDAQRLAAFSPVVIGLLRDRYKFEGVIVSDDLGAAVAVQHLPPGQRATDFIAAGGDLVTVKDARLITSMASAVRARAQTDPAFRQRVDDAALHVLDLKSRHHLLCT